MLTQRIACSLNTIKWNILAIRHRAMEQSKAAKYMYRQTPLITGDGWGLKIEVNQAQADQHLAVNPYTPAATQ